MEYQKPFLSFEDQFDLLSQRGMLGNREQIIQHLKDVGYYRLSGYWHIFKLSDNQFREGTDFGIVWKLYVFDRQFRLLVLDAIERIEVYIRTQLAYQLAKATNPFGFLEHQNLPRFSPEEYSRFMDKISSEFERSREPFILHFKETYGDNHQYPPYWILVNIMDFGSILKLYKGAILEVRATIAEGLGVSSVVLESWLNTLNVVRNVAAHHGRLWNKDLGVKPKIPKHRAWHEPVEILPNKMFSVLTILNYLLKRVAPDTHWKERIDNLFERYPEAHLRLMGFPEDWQTSGLWID